MIKSFLHIKAIFTLMFCASVAMCFASFSVVNGNFDKVKDKEKGKSNTDKYSLKSIHRPTSFFSLSSLGQQPLRITNPNTTLFPNRLLLNNAPVEDNDDSAGTYINSTIQLKTSSNAIIAVPYSFKVKADPFRLFKTPTAPNR